MSARKPLWVIVGGSSLALLAGYINAVGFLGAEPQGVTHVTGQATNVGIAFSHGEFGRVGHAALLVLFFLGGALISGAIIRRPERSQRGRRYGVVLGLEVVFLVVATLLMLRGVWWADDFVAMAAGLQNAMVTSYSGAALRTTHMTGIVTDLGILLGHALRGEQLEREKFGLLGMLLFSFVSGGVIGAYGAPRLGELALLPPAAMLTIASLVYTLRAHLVPDPHRPGAGVRSQPALRGGP
jgi:uncharacterized membrane protein YoaK (UPF0700 family)